MVMLRTYIRTKFHMSKFNDLLAIAVEVARSRHVAVHSREQFSQLNLHIFRLAISHSVTSVVPYWQVHSIVMLSLLIVGLKGFAWSDL